MCVIGHREAQPVDVQYQLRKVGYIEFTRPVEVLQQDQVQDEVIEGYKRDLKVISRSCLYC